VLVGPVYPYRGGIAHYTTMLYRALRKRGHEVLMISFKRQYPRWLFPGHSDKDPSKKPLLVEDARYWIDSLNPLSWLVTFWRICRYQPDVLVLQWWTSFWAPAWIVLGTLQRALLRRPLVYICHNVLPHEARWWDALAARCVLRLGTRFVVQSKEERERLQRLLPNVPIAVVPHPMYDMFAGERIPKDEARKRLGLPIETPVLLFFGIVRKYKGLRDLLRALPSVREQLGNVILVVAGEFWEDKEDYLRLIEDLNIADSVFLYDRYIPNEEIPLFFSAADVLVAPYRQATGSGVVELARGLGKPVITTQKVLDSKDVPLPADSQTLAKAIVRFFTQDSPPERGDNGRPPSSWDDLVALMTRRQA